MTVVSHFRAPKVQQVGLAALSQSGLTLRSNPAVTPKDTPDCCADMNFGFCSGEVYPSAAAFSGPHLNKQKAADSSAPTGANSSSLYLINEGGMA